MGRFAEPFLKNLSSRQKEQFSSLSEQLQLKLFKRWQAKAQSFSEELEAAFLNHQEKLMALPKNYGYPPDLPIIVYKKTIIEAISSHQAVVVAADTGSGKSTQLPKFCLEAGLGKKGKIVMVQPRRLGAISIANRLSAELKEETGKTVGYNVRFNNQTNANNFIEIMTDGMLLSIMQQDKQLLAYDVVIIDEAHERSLNIDFLLGLLKIICQKRPSLKIIISSATIDTEKFSIFLDHCPVIVAEGRLFPITLHYKPFTDEQLDLSEQIIEVIKEIFLSSTHGDVLVFLPTEDDIYTLLEALETLTTKQAFISLPLFARLTFSQQQKIFEKTAVRKIIASTNIAETTLTLPLVRFVIDSGLARISQYNSVSRMQTLPIVSISQASANQRKGRAGRVAEGVCYRLYSEEDFLNRLPFTPPEIQRSNLTEVLLRMLSLGIDDFENFPFLDTPKHRFIKEAIHTLFELKAINSVTKKPLKLTKDGLMMAKIPLDPRHARILLTAKEEGCLMEATIIVSALAIQEFRERPQEEAKKADNLHKTFYETGSDFLFYLNVYKEAVKERRQSLSRLRKFCQSYFFHFNRVKEWFALYDQLTLLLKDCGFKASSLEGRPITLSENLVPTPAFTQLHRALLSGYLSQFAFLKINKAFEGKANSKKPLINNLYLLPHNKEALIFPNSVLWGKQLKTIFTALILKTSASYMRCNAFLESQWLFSLASHLIHYRVNNPFYSTTKGEVLCYEQPLLAGFVIKDAITVAYARYNAEEAAEIFIKEAFLKEENAPILAERFAFLKSNMALKLQLEEQQHMLRREDIIVGDDHLLTLYKAKMGLISSLVALDALIKQQGDELLMFTTEELLLKDIAEHLADYPTSVTIKKIEAPIEYKFKPQEEDDGYSIKLFESQVRTLDKNTSITGPKALLTERIEAIIRALEKKQRIPFQPIAKASAFLAEQIDEAGYFFEQLSTLAFQEFRVHITKEEWLTAEEKIPHHLRPRFVLLNGDGSEAASSRNLADLYSIKTVGFKEEQQAVMNHDFKTIDRLSALPKADIPIEVPLLDDQAKIIGFAYPAFCYDETSQNIGLKLFNSLDESEKNYPKGFSMLLQQLYKKELNALKQAISVTGDEVVFSYFGGQKAFNKDWFTAFIHRYTYVIEREAKDFTYYESTLFIKELWQQAEKEAKLSSLALESYHKIRALISSSSTKYPHLKNLMLMLRNELESLLAMERWLLHNEQMVENLPRFLKALNNRLERALANPQKDAQKRAEYLLLEEKIAQVKAFNELSFYQQERFKQALVLFADYKAKIFAPELKSSLKSSAAKITELLS